VTKWLEGIFRMLGVDTVTEFVLPLISFMVVGAALGLIIFTPGQSVNEGLQNWTAMILGFFTYE
jgi:hypothetical protein